MDVLIVFSLLRLRAGRVDRPIGEGLTLLQPRRNGDTVDSAGLLVLVPGRAGDVAADDGLNGEDLQLAHLHAAVLEDGAQRRGDLRGQVEGEEVRAEPWDGVGEDLEPCFGAEREKDAFVGDTLFGSHRCQLFGYICRVENWGKGCIHSP